MRTRPTLRLTVMAVLLCAYLPGCALVPSLEGPSTGIGFGDAPGSESPSIPTQPTVEPVAPNQPEVVLPTDEQSLEPTPEPEPQGIPVGSPLVTENFKLVVKSAKVVDSVKATDGSRIRPSKGAHLVLVKTRYTVLGVDAVDITCGNFVIFIRGYDSAGGQMSDTFDTHRIPGNPTCNRKTISGKTVNFNFTYELPKGRTPSHLIVIDTESDWETEHIMRLQ